MSKNRCQCPSPPGGCVECEPGQLAACMIVNGQVEASCTTAPGGLSGRELKNWILSQVTGESRPPGRMLSSRDQHILASGKFVDVRTGRKVNFSFQTQSGYTSAS